MIAAQVPELADGGYWYVLPAVDSGHPVPDGGIVPGWFNSNWCAQYGEVDGILYAVVRSPAPVAVPDRDVTVAKVIAAAFAVGSIPASEKFLARVGGL